MRNMHAMRKIMMRLRISIMRDIIIVRTLTRTTPCMPLSELSA